MGIIGIGRFRAETTHSEASVDFRVRFGFAFVDRSGSEGVITPPSDTHWGSRCTQVADPDGRGNALKDRS